ncbi:alpha/beta hydrolase [Altericroceibacterium spongiae]|uniref:Alpha/beta hydrolase n=1 Tax=Altericroceibacterium spongiae TaxID=2320269 RepID=A0A420EA99_9SPHN|nr:alpha/beta hydrolase-fold protein [Altericroceibacterium spongiae]RKF17604.1 alpha/beta hydrolase [Altericroceibacterium spongiae]
MNEGGDKKWGVSGENELVILPNALRFPLTSHAHSDVYQIDIAFPDGEPVKAGWPAIFLLDASNCFGTCVEAMRRMSKRPDATGVEPAIIIGISGEKGAYDVSRRQRDYTTIPVGPIRDERTVGGAPVFLDFLRQEVTSFVSRHVNLDLKRLTLFGHSLAGYFVLWTMLNHGAFFRNYAAISPSVWWDKTGIFNAAGSLTSSDRRLLLTIGEWEDSLPPWQAAASGSEDVIARRKRRNMFGNVRDLGETLKPRLGDNMSCLILPDEDHVSGISTAIPRMLRMASQR